MHISRIGWEEDSCLVVYQPIKITKIEWDNEPNFHNLELHVSLWEGKLGKKGHWKYTVIFYPISCFSTCKLDEPRTIKEYENQGVLELVMYNEMASFFTNNDLYGSLMDNHMDANWCSRKSKI